MKFCLYCKSHCESQLDYCRKHGKSALIDDLTGTTLDGKYYVKELMGSGGMGAVFLAEHLILGSNVAIKIISDGATEEQRQRFIREGRASMRLKNHPHVVEVMDLVVTNGITYMVQEYVKGHDLGVEMKHRFNQGRFFTPAEVIKVLKPIASALDAAHNTGIIHRDVKPENIMIDGFDTSEPQVKLMDFGIAKFIDRSEDGNLILTVLTIKGGLIGTPLYMSPEQWGIAQQDKNDEIDERADVYSLGALAYHMVSGRPPLEAGSAEEFKEKLRLVMPVPVHQINPQIPEEFSQTISRAMAKDRANRQSSASKFINELMTKYQTTISNELASSPSLPSPVFQQISKHADTYSPDSNPPVLNPTRVLNFIRIRLWRPQTLLIVIIAFAMLALDARLIGVWSWHSAVKKAEETGHQNLQQTNQLPPSVIVESTPDPAFKPTDKTGIMEDNTLREKTRSKGSNSQMKRSNHSDVRKPSHNSKPLTTRVAKKEKKLTLDDLINDPNN